jgi:hypothetical protein
MKIKKATGSHHEHCQPELEMLEVSTPHAASSSWTPPTHENVARPFFQI